MRVYCSIICGVILAALSAFPARSQATPETSATQAKAPLEHLIGTITAIDSAGQTVTVQQDKTNALQIVDLSNAKTLLKVEPTAKDLKSAVRITASDLAVGDRVDVRGTKPDETRAKLNARSVILMSARALEAVHQQQSAEWAHATSGRVTSVDPTSGKIMADVRAEEGTKPISIETSSTTQFSRYSTETGKPAPSQLADIQVGDQVKVIGDPANDGASLTAKKVYSGGFRTMPATIVSITPDSRSLTIKDLANKKEITVSLSADASIHKLPPDVAATLAARLNRGGGASGPAQPPAPQAGMPMMPPRRTGGDIAKMIDATPTISLADLKPGDALVVSGVTSAAGNDKLVASMLVAGVEPILQAVPQRKGGSNGASGVGGDWGFGEMSAPQ